MVGQTISHYKITEKLGEGGMGVVYKAEDTNLKRPIALKFLAAHLLNDAEIKARFTREAEAAAALNHPNVCTVYEIDEVEGKNFISMAFIEGESLEERIKGGPLKLKDALDIATQTAQGLQAAHEKKITHRDIKPANLMITGSGSKQLVTIMDFGLAQLADRSKLTRMDETMGTVTYMSPEQTYGAEIDHRSDIWSLGVVIYEMVTGQQPFKGHYDKAVMYSITSEEPEPMTALRTGVPMELELLVNKCLAKEAGKRYHSTADMVVDLETLSEKLKSGKSTILRPQVPDTASGPSVGAQRPAPERSQPSPRMLPAGLSVALAVAIAIIVWQALRSEPALEPTPIPTYKRLTFRRGTVTSARFAPDGNTIVYSAAWEGGRRELFSTRPESSESRSLNIQDADILAISKTGEMVLVARSPRHLSASFGGPANSYPATLLQASLAGGAPREVLDDVVFADWTPDGELGVARMIEGRIRVELPVGKVLYETPNRIASFRISARDGRIAFSERPFGFGGAWEVATIDGNGDKTILAAPGSGDNLVLASLLSG